MSDQAIQPIHPALQNTALFEKALAHRNRRAALWRMIYLGASVFALLALVILFLTIVDKVFGLGVRTYDIRPAELSTKPLETLSEAELGAIMVEKIGVRRLRVIVRDNLLGKTIDPARLSTESIGQLFANCQYPAEIAEKMYSELDATNLVALLESNVDQAGLYAIVSKDVLQPRIVQFFPLLQTLFNRSSVEATFQANYPKDELVWHSWLNLSFLTTEFTRDPATTGLRIAILGTIYILLLTIFISIPLGIGAAIYLEEYAKHTRFTAFLETLIRNLAGVPSIIYGMLGLAIFVRALGDEAGLTNGRFVGITDTNGRTILSAAFTMSLLILPVIIINSQEAIRAVPSSLREASFGIGATRWQTIWRTVLPAGIPGILTGVILSLARAVGETAPLLVVGGLTFTTLDPNGIFSKFSVIPIQIFAWTSEPDPRYKNVAAAAILTLLVILLTLNATAIVLRQRYSKKLRG
ncbi:MAG: phosphate ABC transporter permease PstA [Anaerolineales bacterium]|nr:phosphate ABC transporter permease PstA [Anaerolineales bacterium]